MIEKIICFQKTLLNTFLENPTQTPNNSGKFILIYIVLTGFLSFTLDNASWFNLMFISLSIIYTAINRKQSIWKTLPVSQRFSITNIYFNFYYFHIIWFFIISVFISCMFLVMYIFASESTFISEVNNFYASSTFYNIFDVIFLGLLYCILAHDFITLSFIKDKIYRLGSILALTVAVMAVAYFSNIAFGIDLINNIMSIFNNSNKIIILLWAFIIFIISLAGGIKISMILYNQRFKVA